MRFLDGMPRSWIPGDSPPGITRIYKASPQTAGHARRFVATCLTACDRTDLIERAELAVSELVTNAIRHATPPRGRIAVRFAVVRGVYLIDVIDGSPGEPIPRDADDLDEGGRGLMLVSAVADEWGHFRRRVGHVRPKVVKVVRAAFV